MDEPIVDYLKRSLLAVGPSYWELIAAECGIAKSLPRKLAYGDRENPGIQKIQPLLTYLRELDSGARSLPKLLVENAGV